MQLKPFINLEEIEEQELISGIFAKLIHMDGMSLAHVRLTKGAILPEHFHVHEQITNIIKGELEMTVDGVAKICKPGDCVRLDSNVPHSARALTDCYAIDVFQPVREDYKK